MSDHKKMIQGLYEAFGEGEIATVIAAFTPEIRWTEAEGFPYGGTYVGGDDILAGVFMRLAVEWDDWSAVPHAHYADGDTVVTIGEYSGTYKATGKSFTAPMVHVWTIENGKISRFFQHTDTVLVRAAMEQD